MNLYRSIMKTKSPFIPTAIIAMIVLLCISSSCSFYRVVPQDQFTSQSVMQYEDAGRYLILHRSDEAWHMSDIQLNNDSMLVKLDFNLGYHSNYLNPKMKGLNEFKKKKEPDVIREVHLYTSDSSFSYSIRLFLSQYQLLTQPNTLNMRKPPPGHRLQFL